MTNEFYRTGNYETNHSTFSGIIYNGDYDACYSMSDIAERIASDWKFDEQCRKNEIARERKRKDNKNAEINL